MAASGFLFMNRSTFSSSMKTTLKRSIADNLTFSPASYKYRPARPLFLDWSTVKKSRVVYTVSKTTLK